MGVAEGIALVLPPPPFGAADRDHERGLPGHEDGGVQHAVLFGPRDLLAIEEEDRDLSPVLHPDLGYRTPLIHFGDQDTVVGEGLIERQVLGAGVLAREQGDHLHSPVQVTVLELQRVERGFDTHLHFGSTFFCEREAVHGIVRNCRGQLSRCRVREGPLPPGMFFPSNRFGPDPMAIVVRSFATRDRRESSFPRGWPAFIRRSCIAGGTRLSQDPAEGRLPDRYLWARRL